LRGGEGGGGVAGALLVDGAQPLLDVLLEELRGLLEERRNVGVRVLLLEVVQLLKTLKIQILIKLLQIFSIK